MSELNAIFPEYIYCTQQIDKETKDKRHIYNDFSIIIEITGCTQAKKRGDKASTIHIYGLEKLFLTDGQKSIDKTMAQFAALLQAADNPQWNVSYNSNLKSIDITCTARKLDKYSSVKFQLSEQCEFTADLSNNNHVDLSVTSENFNLFCPDLDESKPHNYTIWAQQVAYIDKFAAFEYNPQEQNKENEPQEVKAIHKGDWASIQWDLGNLDHYTASLLDENGERKTNVSPYIVQIDKDRKFTLKVKKDNTIVTQSLNVYRTLWEKVAEGKCPDGFTPDPKGNNKFFRRSLDNYYYIFIHPFLYYSEDLVSWKIYKDFEKNKPTLPQKYNYYCCNYLDSYEKIVICYTCEDKIFLTEYYFDQKWTTPVSLKNQEWSFCHAVKKNTSTTKLFAVNNKCIDIFDISNNKLINDGSITMPGKIISIDTLIIETLFDDPLKDYSETYCAILCDNNRAYVYNLDNEYRNNIFEFEKDNQHNIFLIKTNSIYIVLDNYVFELNDKEKFSDQHFSPKDTIKDQNNQNLSFIGKRNSDTFSEIILDNGSLCLWDNKF